MREIRSSVIAICRERQILLKMREMLDLLDLPDLQKNAMRDTEEGFRCRELFAVDERG
jgi:hypothetical protein